MVGGGDWLTSFSGKAKQLSPTEAKGLFQDHTASANLVPKLLTHNPPCPE